MALIPKPDKGEPFYEKALGATRRGHVKAKGGYFGALETAANRPRSSTYVYVLTDAQKRDLTEEFPNNDMRAHTCWWLMTTVRKVFTDDEKIEFVEVAYDFGGKGIYEPLMRVHRSLLIPPKAV
jgi:hypothetical protein